ncbi:stalk domain-containing protein [Paenibacillus sediminis]|uniref:Exopolysaccharide biosynthesis protein n=1 Tax=Paenibacillus sediminis TaxID=664909 RepID=A0ABS4H2R5_9BACL|nr:stalk domain-containing protein [Paenibacillus sediminis]MBP1936672.1 exopolysaccharide biosynthesis protein [Paenibacillus sediminis]
MLLRHDKALRIAAVTGKKLLVITLAGTIIWAQPVMGFMIGGGQSYTALAASTTAQAVKVGEQIITSGARLLKYEYNTTHAGVAKKILADVIEVDLKNPNVKLDVMTGKGGQFATRQSVLGMTQETGAVAGVNGDFFNTGLEGAPLGPQVSQGVLMSSPSQLQGMYTFAVTNNGTPVIDEYTFEGSVTAEDGSTFPLAGINKAAYTPEPNGGYSHVDAMYIYTSAWKAIDRPINSSTTPTEVLVQNGVITQISNNASLPMAVPQDGYILRTHGKAADYVRTHLAVGQKITANYQLRSATTQKLVDPSSFQMMIGGHTILVDQGKASAYSRSVSSISPSSYVARTAVGYSKDSRYAYIITVEKNTNSDGMTLTELQDFMTQVGVWKGINLDGGGSTTMVNRPLAETDTVLTFETSNGGTTQRAVSNGLGVFSVAPQGTLKGLIVSGPKQLFIGQQASYSLKGYDTYYNPIDASNIKANFKSSNANMVWTGGGFKAAKAGTATITATSGQASAAMDVKVIGANDIKSLTVGNQTAPLQAGSTISVPVTATLQDGQTISVPNESIQWELIGFQGSSKDGQLTVTSVSPNAKVGYAIARYDGFSTVVVLSAVGENVWEDFENVNYPINFTSNVPEVTGNVSITPGTGDHSNSKVLQLQYDMTAGSGKMYAYAQLNGTNGKTISSPATSMSIDVMGDSSLNWLRAEVLDKDNKTVYIDLAKQVDWTGWKRLTVDLTGYNIGYPAKLKRLYLVNVEEGQDERARTGAVAFDNIKFTVPSEGIDATLPKNTVQMVLGQKSIIVGGKKQSMDVAPTLKNNSTYVPIRYIMDAFNGSAQWNANTKTITVMRGSKLLQITVGQTDFILNGKRQKSEVAPMIIQGRTLVPLRLVSEQLGLDVNWEQKTKTITIHS